VSLAVSDQAYAFARVGGGDPAVVMMNNAASPAELDVPTGPAGLPDGVWLGDRLSGAPRIRVEGGRLRVTLPARAAALYTVAP